MSRNLRRYLWLTLGVLPLLYMACAGSKIVVPPVSSAQTGTHIPGKFVWFDLVTNDVPAVKQFYGGLFGWEFEGDEDTYTTITYQGAPVGGIINRPRQDAAVNESRWIGYLSVPDVDQAVATTEQNGGTVYREARDYPDRGRIAVVGDAQGAVMALIRAEGGDPPDEEVRTNDWAWMELWTRNVSGTSDFYRDLVGYELEEITPPWEGEQRVSYRVFKQGERASAGLIEIPWEEVNPTWLPYVLVDDAPATAEQAEKLGGEILIAPDKNIRNGEAALIADPSGAYLAIQQEPDRDN